MRGVTLLLIFISTILNARGERVLSLDSCRMLAIENNKQLKISAEKITQAGYEEKSALAQRLPNISFTGTYMHSQRGFSLLGEDKLLPIGTKMGDGSFGFTPEQINNQWTVINGKPVPLGPDGMPFDPSKNPELIDWKEYAYMPKSEFETKRRNVWAGIISLVQPIYMGGKISAYNKIAKYAGSLAELQFDSELQDIILRTDEAYWQIVQLAHKKQLTESFVKLLKKMDSDIQDMISEGIATKADGLSVRVRLNEAEMAHTKVENGLALSRMVLAQLCGLPIHKPLTLKEEKSEQLSWSQYEPGYDMSSVINQRSEVRSLKLATEIYKQKERLMLADMLPNLAFTANYIVTNPNVFNGIQYRFSGMWSVGVAMEIPIFHWGNRRNQWKYAKSETVVKNLELQDAKEKIELQISQSQFRLDEARKNRLTALANMESAEENLRHADLGFHEGVIPVINVMEAQTAWLQANSELIDAQVEEKIAESYLRKALGELHQ